MGTHAFQLDKYQPIVKILKKRMDHERYWHTLGVAYTAASLAMAYGCDFEKAYLAGLLHDCAKPLSGEEKLALANEAGIEISDVARLRPGLLHAPLGAYLARTEFGVTDEEILRAIETHTTGRPEMSLLQKIIFVADYIEPNRPEFPTFKEIRACAFQDIDKAVYLRVKRNIDYLKECNETVFDENSVRTMAYYRQFFEEGSHEK